jgi:hypothetical protein
MSLGLIEAAGDDGVLENIGDLDSEAEAIDWIVLQICSRFQSGMRLRYAAISS